MHKIISNGAKSLTLKGRTRRASIIANNDNTIHTIHDITVRATELDGRRQAQITQQSESITDFVAFLEERELMADYVVWKEARSLVAIERKASGE